MLVSFLVALPCFAEPPMPETIVQNGLLKPLAAKEAKRTSFGRGERPAQARRVRVLDAEPKKDTAGKGFVTFAIDARHGIFSDAEKEEFSWRKDVMTGCVYPESGEIFVKRGERFAPAAVLLGKKVSPNAQACQAQSEEVVTAL